MGLGHRRLSIIDLSEGGKQPMQTQDGRYTLIFNGEIYNYQEQRGALERAGYRFRSQSDTEVLLALYVRHGKECLQYLRGMFAFAVYDREERTLFIARDRVGKKPLKYFRSGNVFAFASELKALRTLPECPRQVDFEAVHHYLTMMHVPAPGTGFVGIEKLPAGHCMTLDLKADTQKIERYWALKVDPDESVSEEEWRDRILIKLKESVALRMVADVPVGAFLSGGVDSAAIVALMSRLSPRPVKTFTIGSEDPSFNELPDAQRIADLFSTDHHPIVLEADIVRLLPELVSTYEEPYADPSAIPTYLLARETRKDVTVALNGDGGDENFAGYVRYRILPFSQKWSRMPSPLHALVRAGTGLFHKFRDDTFSYRVHRFQSTIGLPWEQRYLQYLSFFTDEEKRALYRAGFAAGFPKTDAWYADRTADARTRAPDLARKAMLMDMETYLPEDLLPKVDLGTMAHALEARSPFLDHELLELSARVPTRFLIHGGHGKWILKQLLKDILPAETLHPKKKRGFRLPLDRWFRGDLKEFTRERLLESSGPFWQVFERSKVEKFLGDYHASRVDRSDHVWALLWLREWMDLYT